MPELIDSCELDKQQSAELFEGGVIWLHDNGTAQDIKLDAKAAERLFDFLLKYAEQIIRQAENEDAHA